MTFRTAIFHVLPIFSPLLAPFKWQTTTKTFFWSKAILGLCHSICLHVREFNLSHGS